MGRFSDNGLKKTTGEPPAKATSTDTLPLVEDAAETLSSVGRETSKPVDDAHQKTSKPINQYTQAQMKPVNVGGFRVPLIVRVHWQNQAKLSSEKVATQLRAFLVERYGLPDGIGEDDLIC